MIADLLAQHGVLESCELRSTVGFMALHGGSLERGTAEAARRAANAIGASLYAVEQPEDLKWHVPSHLYDPDVAPNLRAFLDHVEIVVSLHGYGREDSWTRILVGGSNRIFATTAAAQLRAELDGFEVVDDVAEIPRELRGLHPRNPVNLPRGGGIQIELPPRVRGLGPRGEPQYVDALVRGLARVFI